MNDAALQAGASTPDGQPEDSGPPSGLDAPTAGVKDKPVIREEGL